MRIPPLSVLFTFPKPNYDDPVTRGPSLIILNSVFMALVLLAVTGRFYSRICIQKWFGVDDAMCVFASIFTIAMTTVVVLADVKYGWDRHIWDLHPSMIQSANIIAFIAKIMFTLAATFTRLSLICFYYRLIKDSGIRWFIWVLHASVLWQIALCITFVALTVWLCDPVESYWLFPPMANYKCLDEGKVMLGGGIVSSISDFMAVILPIPIIMRLQMPLWHRIGVCVLLCLGIVVTIAGSLRTYWTWKSLIKSYDETWYAYPLWIAAAVEIDLGVVCACAPALKSLLQRPIRVIASKISSKLSSLRSPGNTQKKPASVTEMSIFSPLRSLRWFQIPPGFRGTQRGEERYDLERDDTSAIELQHKGFSQEGEAGQGPRASDSRNRSSWPSRPSLQINMRQSFDQCSDYVGGSCQPAARSRPKGPVSGEWLSKSPR